MHLQLLKKCQIKNNMEKMQSSLQNALELANIDFNNIFDFIANYGSIEDYKTNAKKLGTEFERELSLLVLQSTPEQIKTFANLNLVKIDIAIKQININKDCFYLKNKSKINNDPIYKEMFEDIINPILEVHYAELTYIKRLLVITLDNSLKTKYGDIEPEISINETNSQNGRIIKSKDNSLSEFGEFLEIKDMEKIFRIKRNTIYRWEREGRIKRCTNTNKKVLFKKEDIQFFLESNRV